MAFETATMPKSLRDSVINPPNFWAAAEPREFRVGCRRWLYRMLQQKVIGVDQEVRHMGKICGSFV